MPWKYNVETVPFTNRAHLVCPPQTSCAVSEFCFAAFKKNHASVILPVDHENTVRVNRILSRIVGAIYLRLAKTTQEPLGWAAGLDWEAVILQDDRVRAKCWVGGGKIVLCTGLLDRFGTDKEITSILAHEVGHVVARHSSEMIVRFVKCMLLPTFLVSPLFRRHELEADYIGMMLLAACGFDLHIAPQTLEKPGKIKGEHIPNHVLYFLALSVHPSPKERSKFLSRPKVMEEAMRLYTQVTSAG